MSFEHICIAIGCGILGSFFATVIIKYFKMCAELKKLRPEMEKLRKRLLQDSVGWTAEYKGEVWNDDFILNLRRQELQDVLRRRDDAKSSEDAGRNRPIQTRVFHTDSGAAGAMQDLRNTAIENPWGETWDKDGTTLLRPKSRQHGLRENTQRSDCGTESSDARESKDVPGGD